MFSILVALSLPGAWASEPLDWRTLDHVERFLEREHKYDVAQGHETVVRLKRDDDRVAQKTRYAVVVISGLYNSPASIRPFETFFVEKGYNVIGQRLAGHYEADRSSLDYGVRWQTWKAQAERAVALARELGDEVVLVGHSTGGLLSIWLAVDHPQDVAALAVLAPAFGIHKVSGVFVSLMHAFKFGREIPDGRYVTGHAANQVRRLGEAFFAEMAAHDAAPFAHVARRLAKVPVWMANTSLDKVIDLKLTNDFFAALEREGGAPREKDLSPMCELIIHDQLASAKNPRLATLLRSLDAFHARW